MSKEAQRPFMMARPLESVKPPADGRSVSVHHLGAIAAISLRNTWGSIKGLYPDLPDSTLHKFSASLVTLVYEAEIRAAVRDENTDDTNQKELKRLKSELERHTVQCNKAQSKTNRSPADHPTLPISEQLQVSRAMFGGVQIARRQSGLLQFIVRLDDPYPVTDQNEEAIRGLHAERNHLVKVIHEKTGIGPSKDDGVGIIVGEAPSMFDDLEVSYGEAGSVSVTALLQNGIAKGIVEAPQDGIVPAIAGSLDLVYEDNYRS